MSDGAAVSTAQGFVVSDDGMRWRYNGSLTFDNAVAISATAAELPLPKRGIVDCSGFTAVDSSAVAVLLSLKRRAKQEDMALALDNIPPALRALATVYGVDEILTAKESAAPPVA